MGGGHARVVAVIEPPRCAEFLTEIAGVYGMNLFGKILSVFVPIWFAGFSVPVLIAHDAAGTAFFLALGTLAIVGAIDAWSMRVVISPEGVSRKSWTAFFNFSAPVANIRRISVMEKGSLFLSVDYGVSKSRVASLASGDRARILRAAGSDKLRPA